MEQVRTHFRKNENSDGIADSSDTNLSNEDQELDQTIPTLVSEIFLEELRDVRLLKMCRLVCTSWNIVASKSLRACSVVSLKENSWKLKDFATLLRKHELRSFQHFPSPFQNFRVEGRSFTDPTFINLVFTPSIMCTSLIIDLHDKDGMDLDQSQLSLFLAAKQGSIEDLVITGRNNPGFQLNEALVNDAIRLTSVKSLTISDNCYPCTHIQFWQNIMLMCRLAYLELNICDNESLPSLLLQDQFTHIKDLNLFCWKLSRNVFTRLANTKWQLRALSIFDNGSFDNQYLQEWYSFLENVSPTLMRFQTNLPISNKLRFPKLKWIHIQNYNNVLPLLEFPPNNFPSLTKVSLETQAKNLASWENFEVSHKGVQYCVIEGPGMIWILEHEVFMLLMFVSRQFPSVTSLDFSISHFQSSTFANIFKAFPSLKTLKLDGECTFLSFAGFGSSSLNPGLPVEMIPRKESILDFKVLEVIKFGSKFVVSPDMIRHCLARIPKLKQIALHWNSSLSAPLFRDFLGHLVKIVISGPRCFEAEMIQVQKLLPNSVVML